MSLKTFRVGQAVEFFYSNHEGKRTLRRVLIESFSYGSNEWYPEPQFFLNCWDFDRNARRSFAFANIEAGSMEQAT